MKKDNLVKRLGKKVLPYVLAGSLSLGSLLNYRCSVSESPDSQKPVAVLSAQPTEGYVPLSVNFDGSQSYALEGYIQEYLWDFGDGKTDTTTSAFTNYLYENGGEYSAGLVVVDNSGQKSNKALERILVNDDIVPLGEIAFLSNPNSNDDIYSGEIVVKNNIPELRNVKRLTTHSSQDLYPAWSPDGTEIAFMTTRSGPVAVWKMNADGSNQTDITSNLVERAMDPRWGSNGKIAILYINSDYSGIGIIDSDGNSFTSVYSEPSAGYIPGSPVWSPDCSKISFQKYVEGNLEIFSMNADGSNLENITNHPAKDVRPIFMPDGKILFSSDRANPGQIPEEYDLWLMNADGSNPIRLTTVPRKELNPELSPDEKYIVFTRFFGPFGNPSQLFLTEWHNLGDESQWTQLTTEGANIYPTWKPKIND